MKNIVQRFKSCWWALALMAVFWMVFLTVCSPLSDAEQCSSRVGSPIGQTAPVTDNALEMSFTCTKDNLNGIRFYSSGTDDQKGPHYRVSLFRSDDSLLASQDVASTAAISLSFDTCPGLKGERLTVRIEPLAPATSSPATFSLMEMGFREEACHYEDGTTLEGALRYSLLYTAPWFRSVEMVLLLCVIAASFLLVLLFDHRLDRCFLGLAALALMLILVVPFPNTCDEGIHFLKSTAISEAHPFAERVSAEEARERGAGQTIAASSQTEEAVVTGEIEPANFDDFVGYFKPLTIKAVLTDYESWRIPFSDETIFYANMFMSSYPPPGHTPAAIGIGLGRLLHLPAFLVIWLGRLASFAVFVALAWYAIRISEKYKGLIFCLCSMSSLLIFATAVTADTLLNISCILILAICLHYHSDGELTMRKRDIALMLMAVVVIASEKYLLYTPILLLFFLIPKRCFGSVKKWALVLGGALLLTAAAGGQQLLLLKAFPYVEVRRANVDVGGQIAYAFAHTGEVLKTLLRNIKACLGEYYIIRQLPMTVTQVIPGATLLGGLSTALIAVSAVSAGKMELPKKWRLPVVLGGFFLTGVVSVLIVACLYAGFTAVGADYVDGVQARYFFPIITGLAFLVSAAVPDIGSRVKQEKIRPVYACLALLGLVYVLATAFTVM